MKKLGGWRGYAVTFVMIALTATVGIAPETWALDCDAYWWFICWSYPCSTTCNDYVNSCGNAVCLTRWNCTQNGASLHDSWDWGGGWCCACLIECHGVDDCVESCPGPLNDGPCWDSFPDPPSQCSGGCW